MKTIIALFATLSTLTAAADPCWKCEAGPSQFAIQHGYSHGYKNPEKCRQESVELCKALYPSQGKTCVFKRIYESNCQPHKANVFVPDNPRRFGRYTATDGNLSASGNTVEEAIAKCKGDSPMRMCELEP